MQAQVVGAPLHIRRGERDAERVAERWYVLEVDLFLEGLGAGRYQDALTAEDRRHEVREGLAGASPRFGEQHASVLEDVCHPLGHLELSGTRFEVGERPGKRALARKSLRDLLGERL